MEKITIKDLYKNFIISCKTEVVENIGIEDEKGICDIRKGKEFHGYIYTIYEELPEEMKDWKVIDICPSLEEDTIKVIIMNPKWEKKGKE